jgi:hypothetical protein
MSFDLISSKLTLGMYLNDILTDDLFSCDVLDTVRKGEILKPFQVPPLSNIMHQHDIEYYSLSFESLSLLAMFLERGKYSGHPYQPDVNHRIVNYNTYHNKTSMNDDGNAQEPLFRSMVLPHANTGFSNGDLIAIHFYEIKTGQPPATSTSQHLLSGSSFSIPFPEKETFTGGGEIKNRYADVVSNQGLKRALLFFGYRWMKEKKGKKGKITWLPAGDDEPVTLETLVHFATLFNDRIMTEFEFKCMISKYGLKKIFQYDPSKTIEHNRRDFFSLANAFMPIRCCVFDGKHRFNSIVHFLTGGYKAQPHLQLNESPYQEFDQVLEFGGVPRADVKYTNMQCFQPQNILIGAPEELIEEEESEGEGMTMDERFAILRQFGLTKTEAAVNHVQETVFSLLLEFTQFVDKHGLMKGIQPLNYDNFWANLPNNDCVAANGHALFQMLMRFATEKGKKVALQGGGQSWTKLEETLRNKTRSHDYPLGTTVKNPKLTGVSSTLLPIITLIKYLMQQQDQFELFKMYLQQVESKKEQSPIGISYRSHFIGKNFVLKVVIGQAASASIHLINKLMIERKMLQCLRLASNNEIIADVLSHNSLDFKKWSSLEKKVGFSFPLPTKGQYYSHLALNMGQFSGCSGKFNMSVHQTILCDCIGTIAKFGMNPKFTRPLLFDAKNKLLDLYLK